MQDPGASTRIAPSHLAGQVYPKKALGRLARQDSFAQRLSRQLKQGRRSQTRPPSLAVDFRARQAKQVDQAVLSIDLELETSEQPSAILFWLPPEKRGPGSSV